LTTLKRHKVEVHYGTASFVDAQAIALAESGEQITAEQIIIATGSSHRDHPTMPLVEGKILSSRELFQIERLPDSVLVIGAGAIGCEFASFFHAMGAEVTLAEYTKAILPIEEADLSRTLKRELERRGITVHVDAEVTQYTVTEQGVDITMRAGKKELEASYEMVLIAVGRQPNTAALALEKAEVKSERGFIAVNGEYQSVSNPRIYAIGDVIATPALAHVAYYEAKRLSRILLDQSPMESSPIFPSVTFSTPQVASIGASEASLKAEGRAAKSKKHFFKSNAKAKIKGDDSGFVKVIYDPESEVILGAAIIGNDATELIHQFLIAINKQVTLGELGEMIFAHPTLSEVIGELPH
jgi:dihydrolipoamide dehydrogenase